MQEGEGDIMARLIDADALIEHLDRCIAESKGLMRSVCVAIKCFVQQMPTVDAVPVVHGRWITDEKGVTYCGRCRIIDDYASVHNYCPNCGARMDLKEE